MGLDLTTQAVEAIWQEAEQHCPPATSIDRLETIYTVPSRLGSGCRRELALSPGLDLSIICETSHEDVIERVSENEHPVQFAVYLSGMLILLGFVTTLYLGGKEALQGRLSIGTYGFMVFIVQDLLWPFTALSEIIDEYQRAMASTRRVMGLLDTPTMIPAGDRAFPLNTIRGEVQFNNITFAYSDRNPVLKQFSLQIPAKTTLGIVGITGSGKSTLVKLLLRFYDVQSGRVLVDDQDIQTLNLSDLRRCIGWVSQDVFLFHGTVAENIGYGSFAASHQQIIQAAKSAEADEFIRQLPQGYDTLVGERGQKLSGGQRQRLAIARAILKNPPILILDEATSAVDNETEAAIQKSLTVISQNRTTIAIAHRLSTIRHADCICVMDKGQIVEQGTHNELLAFNQIYARLWQVQSGHSQATAQMS